MRRSACSGCGEGELITGACITGPSCFGRSTCGRRLRDSTRPWFRVRNGFRAAAYTRRHRLRLFDNGRGRRKKWLAGLPGAIRSRAACRQIRLRWRRDVRRPERQLLVAPDEGAAPGNHVATGSPGDESIWRQARGENSGNRQGRRPNCATVKLLGEWRAIGDS